MIAALFFMGIIAVVVLGIVGYLIVGVSAKADENTRRLDELPHLADIRDNVDELRRLDERLTSMEHQLPVVVPRRGTG